MKLVFVLNLLTVYVSATPTGVVEDTKGRIFDGKTAQIGQFPYQVFVNLTNISRTKAQKCSGVILNKDWIITAGFCVDQMETGIIQAGTTLLNPIYDKNSVAVPAGRLYFLDAKSTNTIALIRLKTPLTLKENSRIQPIEILKEEVEENTKLTVSGWGRSERFYIMSDYLQFTELKVISGLECQKAFPRNYDANLLCLNSTSIYIRKQICEGDGGSPLVLYRNGKPLLVGIGVVWGQDCGKVLHASGFVKVNKYLGWIKDVTGLDF